MIPQLKKFKKFNSNQNLEKINDAEENVFNNEETIILKDQTQRVINTIFKTQMNPR